MGVSAGHSIGRANLDGTGVNQDFIRGASAPCGVAVDGAYVYWANSTTVTIGRANVEGGGINQNFITGAAGPSGVALDDGADPTTQTKKLTLRKN